MAISSDSEAPPDDADSALALADADEDAEIALTLAAAVKERRLAEADRRRAAALLAAAFRDDLTGALLRKPGREQLSAAMERAQSAGTPLCVMFFDVDNLKAVNDCEGHSRGDELLAATGKALRMSLRGEDVVVRYGGDEFVCALTLQAPQDAAAAIDRVRVTLDQLMPGARVSAGYTHMEAADSLDEAVARADADLYRRRRHRRATDPNDAGHRAVTSAGSEGSVACGACGGRVPLRDFVLLNAQRMPRVADCPHCGATTMIVLAGPALA